MRDDIRQEVISMFYGTDNIPYSYASQQYRSSKPRSGYDGHSRHKISAHMNVASLNVLPGHTEKPVSIQRKTVGFLKRGRNRSDQWAVTYKVDGFRALLYFNASSEEGYLCCKEDFEVAAIQNSREIIYQTFFQPSNENNDGAGPLDASIVHESRRGYLDTARTTLSGSILLEGEITYARPINGACEPRLVFVVHDIAGTSRVPGMRYKWPFKRRHEKLYSIMQHTFNAPIFTATHAGIRSLMHTTSSVIHVTMKPMYKEYERVPRQWKDDSKNPIAYSQSILPCGTARVATDGIIGVHLGIIPTSPYLPKSRKRKRGGTTTFRSGDTWLVKWKPSTMSTVDVLVFIDDILHQQRNATSNGTCNVNMYVAARAVPDNTDNRYERGRRQAQSRRPMKASNWPTKGSTARSSYLCIGRVMFENVARVLSDAFSRGVPQWSAICVEVAYDYLRRGCWVIKRIRIDRTQPNSIRTVLGTLEGISEGLGGWEFVQSIIHPQESKQELTPQQKPKVYIADVDDCSPYSPTDASGFQPKQASTSTAQSPDYFPKSPPYVPTSPIPLEREEGKQNWEYDPEHSYKAHAADEMDIYKSPASIVGLKKSSKSTQESGLISSGKTHTVDQIESPTLAATPPDTKLNGVLLSPCMDTLLDSLDISILETHVNIEGSKTPETKKDDIVTEEETLTAQGGQDKNEKIDALSTTEPSLKNKLKKKSPKTTTATGTTVTRRRSRRLQAKTCTK